MLVAFDGSDASFEAAEFAGQLAKPGRLPLTLFSAGKAETAAMTTIADAARLVIANLKLEGVYAEHVVTASRVVDGLLACQQQSGADLIVLYRHTRGGLARTLLGSVSHEVIRRAEVPVLLVGGSAESAATKTG